MNHYISLIILIIITNYHINAYITLNLLSYKFNNDTYTFPDDFVHNYYYTKISLGNPPQKFDFKIELQNQYTAVLNEKANSSLKLFQTYKSNTYKQILYYKFESDGLVFTEEEIKNQNYSNKFNGYISKDVFNINNNIVNDFIFISVNETISKYSFKYLSGILGLGIKLNNELEEHRLIAQLKRHNIINDYSFYFKDINTDNPLLIIGDTPLNLDSNICSNKYIKQTKSLIYMESYEDIAYVSVPVWGLKLDKVYIGNNEINKVKNTKFSIEYNIIIGTVEYEKLIRQLFFDKYIDQQLCFINNTQEYKYFYCKRNNINKQLINYNDMPILSFYSSDLNYTFEFKYNDLFIEKDDYIIYLVFFNSILYSDRYYWTFGKPFFKKYMPYFNLDKKLVGICVQDTINKPDLLYTHIIVILIIVLIILMGVFYICIKKYLKFNRKKIRSHYLEKAFIHN